jgi:hypothetical protein
MRATRSCVVASCFAAALISVTPASGDVNTDLWDIQQGCQLTGASTHGVYIGSDLRNMFGGNLGTIEVGNTVFYDAQIFGPGTVTWVSWSTPEPINLSRFVLTVAADGNYPATYNRAIQGFNLYISDTPHLYDSNWGAPVFQSGLLPTPLGEYSNGIYNYTLDHTFPAALTGQHFKADFVHGSYVTGPRIIELDGYGTIPEPAALALLTPLLLFLRPRN